MWGGLSNMTRSTAPSTVRPIPRRALSRVEAAMYLGISPSKFDELRKEGGLGQPKFSTAASCLPSKYWTNFSRRCRTKPMIRPKTGRLAYERDSLPGHAPQTSTWLCRGP